MADQKSQTGGGSEQTPVDQYDAQHGKYQDNVPQPPPIPNIPQAAADPSPFKLGPT